MAVIISVDWMCQYDLHTNYFVNYHGGNDRPAYRALARILTLLGWTRTQYSVWARLQPTTYAQAWWEMWSTAILMETLWPAVQGGVVVPPAQANPPLFKALHCQCTGLKIVMR